MRRRSGFAVVLALVGAATSVITPAQAQDFFSFFGNDPPGAERPAQRLPYADDGGFNYSPRANRPSAPRPRIVGSGQSYCVRTCDGRFFPISAGEGSSSRVANCKSMCPSSETKVYSGNSIDTATADGGKAYASLPNAFRFRTELVAGCTCNGKDQLGLAPVSIENDTTVRKGDIVAGADGLTVSRPTDKRGASLQPAASPDRADATLVSEDR